MSKHSMPTANSPLPDARLRERRLGTVSGTSPSLGLLVRMNRFRWAISPLAPGPRALANPYPDGLMELLVSDYNGFSQRLAP
jgi:hypothetical protein